VCEWDVQLFLRRRWQSLTRRLRTGLSSVDIDVYPEDAANNFLGYNMSTGVSSTRKRCFKKYATDDIHPRRVLLVVAAQVGLYVSEYL
jgi:hypothetical protein